MCYFRILQLVKFVLECFCPIILQYFFLFKKTDKINDFLIINNLYTFTIYNFNLKNLKNIKKNVNINFKLIPFF